jgi:hypothetical protein
VFTSRIETIRPQLLHGSPARGAGATRGGGGFRSGMPYVWAEAAAAIATAPAAVSQRMPHGRGALPVAPDGMRYSEMPWTK